MQQLWMRFLHANGELNRAECIVRRYFMQQRLKRFEFDRSDHMHCDTRLTFSAFYTGIETNNIQFYAFEIEIAVICRKYQKIIPRLRTLRASRHVRACFCALRTHNYHTKNGLNFLIRFEEIRSAEYVAQENVMPICQL